MIGPHMADDKTDILPKIPTGTSETKIAPATVAEQNDGIDPADAALYAELKAKRAERRKKKLIRRGIAAGAVVGALIIAAIVIAVVSNSETEEDNTVVDSVTVGTYTTEVSAKGSLKPLSSTVVSPEIDGTIAEVRVSTGQTVNKDDVILVLKNDDIDREVSEAQASVSNAQQELANAKNELAAASQSTVTIDEEGNETVTPGDTSTAQSAVNSAQSTLLQAQNTLQKAQEKQALKNVKAPASGSIVGLNARVGAAVSGGTIQGTDSNSSSTLMEIADLSQMKVTVQVGEKDISKIAQDQTATITFPAFENLSLEGKVSSIASVASTSSSGDSAGGSGVSYDVEVLIPSPDARLKSGMTAQVSIKTEELQNVAMVPVNDLIDNGNGSYAVLKQTDEETHATEQVAVQVVTKNDTYAVIGRPKGSAAGDPNTQSDSSLPESPLKAGAQIVVPGSGNDDTNTLDGDIQ